MNEKNLLDSEELRKNLTFFENTILKKWIKEIMLNRKKGKKSSNHFVNYTFVTRVGIKAMPTMCVKGLLLAV